MFQLDGAAIVTVEGLARHERRAASDGRVSRRAVRLLHARIRRGDDRPVRDARPRRREQVRDGLVGNLCRCTGYEPIIKAALRGRRRDRCRRCASIYPQTIEASEARSRDERTFFAPTTLDDALAFKREFRPCTIVQGGDRRRRLDQQARLLRRRDAVAREDRELNEIREEDGAIVAGANVTLTSFEHFIRDRIPELHRILSHLRLAADQERRHARRQHRERLADRRHAALPHRRRRELEIASVDGTRPSTSTGSTRATNSST